MEPANDEDLALALHKELNAIPRRARRGVESGVPPTSLDAAARPERARSVDAAGRKRRTSDDGHTSARHHRLKGEDSGSSHPGNDERAQIDAMHRLPEQHASGMPKPSSSRGSRGTQQRQQQRPRSLSTAQRQQQQLATIAEDALKHYPPELAAAAVAAARARQLAQQEGSSAAPGKPQKGTDRPSSSVKVFLTGARWGLSLPRTAVRSRSALAHALNEAFVGSILSLGNGQMLAAVFVDARGTAAELGPVPVARRQDTAVLWRELAAAAVRIYVHPQQSVVPQSCYSPLGVTQQRLQLTDAETAIIPVSP